MNTLATQCEELTQWKRPWCSERLRAGGEGGAAEDENVGWHHLLNGPEFEHTPGDSEGQGNLAWCHPKGHKEVDTTEGLHNSASQGPQSTGTWTPFPCNSSSCSKPTTLSADSRDEIPICKRMYYKSTVTTFIRFMVMLTIINSHILFGVLSAFLFFWLEWINPTGLVNNDGSGIKGSGSTELQNLPCRRWSWLAWNSR